MHLDAGQLKLDETVLYSPGYDPSTKWTGDNLDDLPDGVTYQRVKSTAVSADGMIILDQVVAGTYGLVRSTDITAGHIKLSTCSGDLDDIDNGTTYQKLLATDISSGHIKLTTGTVWSGKVTVRSGVTIDSASGINIWGLNNALTTRATETGTIQCYVGSDGKISAGGTPATVTLGADGVIIKGQEIEFQTTGGTAKGYVYGLSTGLHVYGLAGLTLTSVTGTIDFQTGGGYGVDMTACDFMGCPRVSSAPATSEGRLYFNTTDKKLYLYTTLSGTTKWWTFQMS
jgi:hypothetical protein